MDTQSSWKLTYNKFVPEEEKLRETLCTLGNGYFGTRGAPSESFASELHYPGTYLAGVFNKLETEIADHKISNEDMVNCPNWTFVTFKIGNGEWFKLSTQTILSEKQELNMHKGTLTKKMHVKSKKGLKTFVETTRIVHMGNPHVGALQYTITPDNYSDHISIRTMLDGSVRNTGVKRYRQLRSKHLKSHKSGNFDTNGIYLITQTSQSKIKIVEASKIRIFQNRKEIHPTIISIKSKDGKRIGQEISLFANKKQSFSLEKSVCIYTSRDKEIKNPLKAAIACSKKHPKFDKLLASHEKAWQKLWNKADIKIEGHIFSQRAIRLHIFHLLQTVSPHNINIDAGMPARGLHGEAYRGHIFWDELFSMPFFILHTPEIAKSLLMYRYRRLKEARKYAAKDKYCGAMFPWQSGSSGEEETQIMHLNPLSGHWGPDYSSTQRHINFAICYNIWQYWKKTNDIDFIINYGTEIFLSIAQFCASLTYYNTKNKRYHTKGIMGPDEFHEQLPGSSEHGLKDNSYSNIMIVWILIQAKEMLNSLPDKDRQAILKKLKIDDQEINNWFKITKRMNIVINSLGVISQFSGYFKLKELDWDMYRAKYGKIERLDRILKSEGKSPDDYKLSKQADALMMFYLIPLADIDAIFKRLGYKLPSNFLKKNYEYYVSRTSHGSTLSRVVHCFIALELNKKREAQKWYIELLKSDIFDIQGGTTPEGIHTGVMGGSIHILIRKFAGIRFSKDLIKITPHMPKMWKKVEFKFLYRKQWFDISITHHAISIKLEGSQKQQSKVPFEINNEFHYIANGYPSTFKY